MKIVIPVIICAASIAAMISVYYEAAPDVLRDRVTGAQVTPWEHGFKTDRVIATRRKNKIMGQFMGFDFPKDIDNADREEVSDFFDAHGCDIFEGGGYPGATDYVSCDGVADPTSANKKLQEILPPLDKLMADMAAGIPVHIKLPKSKYQWPDTSCRDSDDLNGSLNIGNGHQYKEIRIEPGHCRWTVDAEADAANAQYEDRRQELWQALQTRVLTDAEMKEVLNYGDYINIPQNVPFNDAEKQKERGQAFIVQEELRAAARDKRPSK